LIGVDVAAHGPLHYWDTGDAQDVVRVEFLRGRMQAIPLADGIADLTWCRDALSCAPAVKVVPELARITRPGGDLLIHTTCATSRLEPGERRWLFDVLGLAADSMDRDIVESLFAAHGLDVTEHVRLGNQSLQHRLEADPASSGVLGVARMIQDPDRFIAAWGAAWYERIRAFETWPIYLALGKLEDHIWQLHRQP
jgi:SAM-dependent methyltransferase